MENNEKYRGLEGWLYLIGISLIYTPISLFINLIISFHGTISDNRWKELTSVNLDSYIPYWGTLIIGEFIYDIVMIIASIYLLYLFFSKHYRFPIFFIILIVISPVFLIIDTWLTWLITPNDLNSNMPRDLKIMIIRCIIWIPYMFKSKRVKATFVEKKNYSA